MDINLDKIQQIEERDAFQSVFPDFITSSLEEYDSIKLEIPITLNSPHRIHLFNEIHDAPDSNPDSESFAVSSLPPLFLHILFPPEYPSSRPPDLLLIRATGLWFTHILKLRDLLISQWQPGCLVLDLWTSLIFSGDFLHDLGFMNRSSKEIRLPSLPQIQNTVPLLLQQHDSDFKTKEFTVNSYFCSLCLEHMKGSRCLQLASCGHIICRSCLHEFWSLCIAEGEIDRVTCPEPDCVKAKTLAKEEDVARIVNPEELQRLHWLREKFVFDKDPTVIPCPLSFCQAPVVKPPETGEPGWDKFRSCTSCSFAFCCYCRRTWHGPVAHCPISSSKTVIDGYLATSPESLERKTLESKYGLANIKRLLEEKVNFDLISNTTTNCPKVNGLPRFVAIEKSLGCNRMTCSRCHSYFCFRCGKGLTEKNPYAHFNDSKSGCNGQLFDGPGEEWDEEDEFNMVVGHLE